MTWTIRNNDWWKGEELVMSKLYKVPAQKWLPYLPDALYFHCKLLYCSLSDVWLIAFRRGESLQTNKKKMLWLCNNIACFSIASIQECCLLYTYKTLWRYRWRWLQVSLNKAPNRFLIRGRIQIIQGVCLHSAI